MENKNGQETPRPGDKYVIPPGGSLGLLALGYKGIIAWRKKRAEFQKSIAEKKKSEDEQK